jgi:hypothetical protein
MLYLITLDSEYVSLTGSMRTWGITLFTLHPHAFSYCFRSWSTWLWLAAPSIVVC